MGTILVAILQIYSYAMLARAIISWIPGLDHYHPIVQLLYRITEPVLEPIRRLVPPLGGTLDISIIIVFIALNILMGLVSQLG